MKSIPIKDQLHCDELYHELRLKHKRNGIIFEIGINTFMPVTTLMSLTLSEVKILNLKSLLLRDVTSYAKALGKSDSEPLFTGRSGSPITRQSFSRIMRDATKKLGYEDLYTPDSLRRTYLYRQYMSGVTLIELRKKYNVLNTSRLLHLINPTKEEEIEHTRIRLLNELADL